MFQTSDLDAGVNEHSPDIIDTAPPMKTFKTIEEEDPYEKVEVKKNKDGLVDINTKISQVSPINSIIKETQIIIIIILTLSFVILLVDYSTNNTVQCTYQTK